MYSDSERTTGNVSPKLQVKVNPGNEQIQFELSSSKSTNKMLISVSKDQGSTCAADSLDNLDCLKIQIQSEPHSQQEVESHLKLCKENSSVVITTAKTAQIESLKLPAKGKNSIKKKMRGHGQDKRSPLVPHLVQEPLPLGSSTLGHKAYLYGNGRFVVDRKDLKSTVKEIVFWRIVKATNQVLLQKFVPVNTDGRDMHGAVDRFRSFEKTDPSFYDRFQPIIFHLTNEDENGTLGYLFDLGAGSVPYFGYFELTDKYYNEFQLFLRKMAKRALQDEVPSNWSSSIEGSSVIQDLLKEIYEKSCFATLLPNDFMECVKDYSEILKRTVGNVNRDETIDHVCEFCKRIGISQKLKREYRMVFVGDSYNLNTLMLKPSSDQPRPPLPDYRLCHSCSSTVKALHRLIHYTYSLFIAFRLQLKQLYSFLQPGQSYQAKEVFDFLLEDPHFNRMTFYEWQAAHGEGIHFYKTCENKVNRYSRLSSSQSLTRTEGKKGKQTQTISTLSEPNCVPASSNSEVSVVSQTPTTNVEEPRVGTSSSVPKVAKKKSQSEISVAARESSKVSREKSLSSVSPNPNPRKPRQKLVKSSDASSSIFINDRPTENLNGANKISITSAETAKHVVRNKNSNIQKRNPRTKGKNREIGISQNFELKEFLASEPDELSAPEKPSLALSIAPDPNELRHTLSASKEVHDSDNQNPEGVVSNCNVSTNPWLRYSNTTKIPNKKVNKKQDLSELLNSLDVEVTLLSQSQLAQPVEQEPDVLSHNVGSPTQIHDSVDLQNPAHVGSTLALPCSSPSAIVEPFEQMPQLIIKLKRLVKSGAEADDVTGSSGGKSITSAIVGDAANVVSSKKKYTPKYTLRRRNKRKHTYKEIRQTRQIIQDLDHITLSSQLLQLEVPVGPEAEELQQNFKISTPAQNNNSSRRLIENDEGISSSCSSTSGSGTNKKTSSSQSSAVSSGMHNIVVLPNESKNQFSQENKVKNDNVNESTSTPSHLRNPTIVSKSKANFKKTVPAIILTRVDEDAGTNGKTSRVIEHILKGKVEPRILVTKVEEDPKLQLLIQPNASSSSPGRLPNSRDARSGNEERSFKTTTDEARLELEVESRRLLRRSVRRVKIRVPYSPSRLDYRERQKRVVVEVPGELQTTAKNMQAKVMSNFKTIGVSHDFPRASQVIQDKIKLGGPLKSKSIKQQPFSKTKETTKPKASKKAIIASEIKRTMGLRNGKKIPCKDSDSVLVAKKKKGQ